MQLPTDNECVCVLSTSKGKELRQNVNVLAEFASEANLLISSTSPGVGSVDAYTVDSDVSLSLVSMTSVFFEQSFYVHPNAQQPSSTLYHPCLNQYVCKSLSSLNTVAPHGINYTTASAVVRIPVVCLHLQNSLRSIVDKDIITFRILWNDPLNLHLNISNTETGTSTNHLLHLLRVRRVFIHRSIPPFPIAHIIRAYPLRNAATTLANVGHDYFYIAYDASSIQLFALRSNHVTTFNIPTTVNLPVSLSSTLPSSPLSPSDNPPGSKQGGTNFKLIAGPFKLAPMLMFIKHRLCNHYVLYVMNRTLAIEGSSAALESIQPIAGHPSNRLLMLIRSAPLEGHRLEEFKGLIEKAVNVFEWKDAIADLILSTTSSNAADDPGSGYGDQLTLPLKTLYSSSHPTSVFSEISSSYSSSVTSPNQNMSTIGYHTRSTLFAASPHISRDVTSKINAASEREGGNRSKIQIAVPTASWVTFGEDEDVSELLFGQGNSAHGNSVGSKQQEQPGFDKEEEEGGQRCVDDMASIMSEGEEVDEDKRDDDEFDEDGNMWD